MEGSSPWLFERLVPVRYDRRRAFVGCCFSRYDVDRSHQTSLDCQSFYFGIRVDLRWGFFFVLTLLTAVGGDIHRNSGAHERTVAWNPLLVWKTYLCLGALPFFT